MSDRWRTRVAALILLAAVPALSHAGAPVGVENPGRAEVNYMLNCQGCHGPQGAGTADGTVPTMKDFVGRFLTVPGGREFLVRVPGSANAALPDDQLAEVLNWMLWRVSPDHIPEGFVPYNSTEVARWRAKPLANVVDTRAALLALMGQAQQTVVETQ